MINIDPEQERIASLIASLGQGAPQKYAALATSASAGNAAAKEEISRFIGRPITTMLDLYRVISAATNCMTVSQINAQADWATRSLNAGANPAREADAYLANRLGKLRREAGLSQSKLANLAGVNLTTLQKLENGTNRLLGARTEIVLRLARALNISVEQLLGQEVL